MDEDVHKFFWSTFSKFAKRKVMQVLSCSSVFTSEAWEPLPGTSP